LKEYDKDIMNQLQSITPGVIKGTWVFDYGRVQVFYSLRANAYSADANVEETLPLSHYVDFTQRIFNFGEGVVNLLRS